MYVYLLWFWSIHHSITNVKFCAGLVLVETRLVRFWQHVHAI
jgi:hypothetical protein